MTLNRDTPTGTARYTPPVGGSQQDIWAIARPPAVAPVQGNLGSARYTVTQTQIPNLYYFRLVFYDERGGMRQRGRFDEVHAGWSSNTMDTRYEQHMVLPQLTTSSTTPAVPSHTSFVIYSAQVFDKLAIGLSGSTGLNAGYLATETSSTNPALTKLVYDRGTFIMGMSAITANGLEYLAVSSFNHDIDLLSDLAATPTIAGSITSTLAVSGIIQTSLPHNPLLVHQGNAMFTISTDVAIGSMVRDSVAACTGIPTGGYAMGLASLGGGPVRAWWNWPRAGSTSTVPGGPIDGAAMDTTLYHGEVWSTAQNGSDPQRHPFSLKNESISVLVRDGCAASDYDRVILDTGRGVRDLRIFADPPVNSNRVLKVVGLFAPYRAELYAEINEIASASGTGDSRRCIWQYDFDLDCWRQVSAWTTFTSLSGIQSHVGAGNGLPWSPLTGFLHNCTTTATTGPWLRQYQPPAGVNPFSLRKTTGAATGTGTAVEASGEWKSTIIDIPGLEGWPKIITRVQGPPSENIQAGGTDAYMTIGVGDGAAVRKFTDREPYGRYPLSHADFRNSGGIQTIQVTATGYRATTGVDPTRFNLNMLPITLEGFCIKEHLDIPENWTSGQE